MNLKRVYIEITNVCNLNCSFCSPLKRKKRFMSYEEFKTVIDKIKPYSPHVYLHVKGEPLLHPDLEKILKYLYSYSIPVNLTTNGTLIENYKDILLKFTRQINISVHSLCDNQIEDKDKYLKSICELGIKAKELKKPYVSYRMWNGSKDENIDDDTLATLRKIASDFGCDISKTIPKGRDAKKLYDNIFISFSEQFEWPSLNMPYISDRGKCLGAKEMLGILCDGTVVPCCLDADGEINLGNIFNESLEDILNKEKFINIAKGFSGGVISEELCRRCSYRTRFNK